MGFCYQGDFEQHCGEILSDRNAIYCDAWREGGLQSAIVLVTAKCARLKRLVLRRDYGEHLEESEILAIRDSLADLHNYCVIANECLTLGLWYTDDSKENVGQRETAVRELFDDDRGRF